MKKIAILSLCLIGSITLRGQEPDLRNKIDSLIQTLSTKEAPGGAIAVVRNGELLYKKVFGLANLDYKIPVTDSTVFNLASTSKQFTAFLALLLEAENKLNLDDPIQKYIPELKNYGHPITIRQLIHHTSGIPSTDNLRLFAGLSLEMPWDKEDEFEMIKSYQKLNFIPNNEHIYSNSGYFLLSRIIEKVEGKSFTQSIKERIFVPLGMKTATIYDSRGKIIHNRASGYRKTGETFSGTYTEGDSFYGSTNMYASVNDLIKWSMNMTTHLLGGKQLVNRLFIPTDTLNNGDTINYTYGFFIRKHMGLKLVEHDGFTPGFKAQVTNIPEAGLSVIFLSNNENTDASDIAIKIVDWSLNDRLKSGGKVEHKEIAMNKELYQLYKGSYILSQGLVLKFDNINDTLKLIIPEAPKFVMYPERENEFFIKDFDAQCTFIKDSQGRVNEIVWHQNNQNVTGVRYEEPIPLSQKELQCFTGEYEIPELNITYPVSLKINELTISLPKSFRSVNIDPELKLKHISGDKFYGSLAMIEFKRNKEGRVTGFVIKDVGRLRNIEFTKKD
jgi:CubicO group peptidase (beta-lactamase class C family)